MPAARCTSWTVSFPATDNWTSERGHSWSPSLTSWSGRPGISPACWWLWLAERRGGSCVLIEPCHARHGYFYERWGHNRRGADECRTSSTVVRPTLPPARGRRSHRPAAVPGRYTPLSRHGSDDGRWDRPRAPRPSFGPCQGRPETGHSAG